MKSNQYIYIVILILVNYSSKGQSTFLPQQSKHYSFIERLEIKSCGGDQLSFTHIKPLESKSLTESVEKLIANNKMDSNAMPLSKVDAYNLTSFYRNHLEWMSGDYSLYTSKKAVFKHFYKSPANLFEHRGDDFFIAVNPLIQYRQSQEKFGGSNLSNFVNQRGLSVRGHLGKKIGFSMMAMDVQERGPVFFRNWIDSLGAVPGGNFYKVFKKDGVDYIDARGYFSFQAHKYVAFQVGYDRQFIGSGYRSMFLSDFSGNRLFVKINTKFWKINYQNLFMELHAGAADNNTNNLVPKKYAAMHHVSMNITRWLNVGLFEGVIFGRKDRFEFGYLNPVIFLRSIEGNLGSRDNAVVGADFKLNILKRGQVYGQLLLDEFNISKMRQQSGWWGNKTSIQLGCKYIDAFSIKNLDMQVEWNRVRPFTYSHFDSVSNYAHYNQPLAHPLGANFNEYVLLLRYQPIPRLTMTGKIIYWQQGLDSSITGYNAGGNIFRLNNDGRTNEFGYTILNGREQKVMNSSFLVSYEWKENIFFDAHILHRRSSVQAGSTGSNFIIGLGFRMNLWFRDYDY
ncbi:MAG: hypothetical protein ACK5BV_06060 [Bacteroidota bacterium]